MGDLIQEGRTGSRQSSSGCSSSTQSVKSGPAERSMEGFGSERDHTKDTSRMATYRFPEEDDVGLDEAFTAIAARDVFG